MPASQNTVKKTGEGGKRCDTAAPMKLEALTVSNFDRVGEIILCVCVRENISDHVLQTDNRLNTSTHCIFVCVCVSVLISASHSQQSLLASTSAALYLLLWRDHNEKCKIGQVTKGMQMPRTCTTI